MTAPCIYIFCPRIQMIKAMNDDFVEMQLHRLDAKVRETINQPSVDRLSCRIELTSLTSKLHFTRVGCR